MADRPLGKILHIVEGEAITRPNQSFEAKGATVVTIDNKIIGKLDYPIGPVDHPYQVIKLNKTDDKLQGKMVIAKISSKKRRRRKSR